MCKLIKFGFNHVLILHDLAARCCCQTVYTRQARLWHLLSLPLFLLLSSALLRLTRTNQQPAWFSRRHEAVLFNCLMRGLGLWIALAL